MKWSTGAGFLIPLALVAVATLAFTVECRAADPVGTVVSVSGGALIRPGTIDPARGIRPVRVNDRIFEGDVINTASAAKVKILLVDKTILDISGGSLFNVKKFSGVGKDRKVELELPYGQVRTAVTQPVGDQGNYRLRSTAATMGVRGTEFIVQSKLGDPTAISRMEKGAPPAAPTGGADAAASAAQSTVTVVQGKVEVAPQVAPPSVSGMRAPASTGPVMLTAGTQMLASTAPMSAPAAPTQLNTDQLRNVTQSARMEDNTFRNSVELDITGERKAEQDRMEQNTSGSGGSSGSAQSKSASSSSSGSSSSSDGGESRSPASSESGSDTASGSGSGGGDSSTSAASDSGAGSSSTASADSGSGGEGTSSASSGETASASGSGSAADSSAAAPAAASSSPAGGSGGGGVANFTASLITSTVAAPPPTVAAIVMPAAVITQSTSSGTSGGGFAGSISASSGITAPPVAVQEVGGGSKRITVIIRR